MWLHLRPAVSELEPVTILPQVFGGGNRYVRLGKSDSDNALFDLSCLSRRRLRKWNIG